MIFTKNLINKFVKSSESLEKEEKRKEIKWKYQLLGPKLVQGAQGKVCKPGVLSTDLNKLLDFLSLSNLTKLLKDGITSKMRILKDDTDEVSFFTNFKVEIVNQAFVVDLKNCIWYKDSIEDYD